MISKGAQHPAGAGGGASLCRRNGGCQPLRHPRSRGYRREGDPDQAEDDPGSVTGRFGFSINTLRHWDQGRRVPEGPTRAYLLDIDRDPKAVEKALGARPE